MRVQDEEVHPKWPAGTCRLLEVCLLRGQNGHTCKNKTELLRRKKKKEIKSPPHLFFVDRDVQLLVNSDLEADAARRSL